MATKTASVTGNWDQTATWGGSAVPTSADTVLINGDIVVTIPAGVTANFLTCTIGQTNNSTGIATLINNGTIVGSGNLVVGNGASKDGKFVFGPSSATSLSAGSFYWNNCQIRSTSDATHWAVYSGTQQITNNSGGVTGPRQDVSISYVSFQHNANLTVVLQDTTGAYTSGLTISNCVFYTTKAPAFGTSTTPATANISVTNSSWRDLTATTTITFQRIAGAGGTYNFSHNDVAQTTSGRITITLAGGTGFVCDNNVLVYVVGSESGGVAGTWSNNLWTNNLASSYFVNITNAGAGSTVTGNLFYTTSSGATNAHPINEQGSGGSGTHTITNNVMDCLTVAAQTPDLYQPGGATNSTLNVNFYGNVVVVAGELMNGSHGPSWAGTTALHRNNTINGTISSATVESGDIFRPEGVLNANGGNLTIRSNLMFGNAKSTEFAIQGATSGSPQVIGYVNNNNYWNVDSGTTFSSGAGGLTISAGNTTKANADPAPGANFDPRFFDRNNPRTLDTWDSYFGGLAGTRLDAESYFLSGFNGYRGTPNFDQQGTTTLYTPAMVRDWIAYGSSPTNLAARGTAFSGDGDIGAMPVRTLPGTFF